MPKRRARPRKDRNEIREEALRPAPSLGYDRDTIAMYLLDRGIADVAEAQLRRAVWLNPYEARFKAHLAWCLYKRRRYAEAQDWIAQALAQNPANEEGQRLQGIMDRRG